MSKQLNILLVGGTGVLSTDVAEFAIDSGMDVTCINRGKHLQFLPKEVHNIVADIRTVEEVTKKLQGQQFDVVVDFLSYSLNDLKTTLEIFNGKCKQFIFISSATVYNKKDENEVISEKKTCIGGCKWDYANKKVECEKYLIDNYEKTGQCYTIIRPYVTYGRTRIPFAVTSNGRYWSLANRILCEKPIVMWDDGEAICTLTHTTEFCKGVVKLFGNKKAINEAFHITSNQSLTWNEVLETIERALGKKAKVINIPSEYIEENMDMYKGSLLGDKATNMRFDNSKLMDAIGGFDCKIQFDEGIEDTISFYQNHDFMREVDYRWDSWLDQLIKKYSKEKGIEINKKDFKCKNAEKKPGVKHRLIYFISKNKKLYTFIHRVYDKLKK